MIELLFFTTYRSMREHEGNDFRVNLMHGLMLNVICVYSSAHGWLTAETWQLFLFQSPPVSVVLCVMTHGRVVISCIIS